MVFSSFVFLAFFLPLTLILHWVAPSIKLKNCVLCVFSLLFYAWGEPIYVLLMLASVSINYGFGLALEKNKHPAFRKTMLAISVTVNLGAIGFFKYGNFILENLGFLTGVPMPVLHVALPIGISFYTFQILSYVIDVYKYTIPAQKSILNLATYISLFPQLIAGPIVRYETVQAELHDRKVTLDDIYSGINRFIIGLGKKVIIANSMAIIADSIYDAGVLPNAAIGWIAALAYMLQIYFDFSGYSDMAIGIGRMFGFHFLENFNYPYISTSVTDFWRRWHISLSTWFRDYVYIPLGGSRVNEYRHMLNLLTVWMLTGLWHGASWNFVLWGMYYGVLLLIEKFVFGKRLESIPKVIRYPITMLLVLMGWVLFRLDSFPLLISNIKVMFSFTGEGTGTYLLQHSSILGQLWMFIPAILGCFPIAAKLRKRFPKAEWYRLAWLIVVFIVSVSLLLASTYNPFIYFRF